MSAVTSGAAPVGGGPVLDEVRISGGVFAGLLHDAACSEHDLEGLLFGKQTELRVAVVGDQHEETVTHNTVLVVQSYLPTGAPLSFYAPDGTIDPARFDKITAGREQDLIGWFKFRRNSTLQPSYRETLVHEQLLRRRDSFRPLVFAMLNASFAENQARHTYDYCITTQHSEHGTFANIRMRLVNLDQSLHDGYSGLVASNAANTGEPSGGSSASASAADSGNATASPAFRDTFNETIADLLRPCVHATAPMYTTESKAVERAYTKVVANIAALSKQVAETDDEVFGLRNELAALRGDTPLPRPLSSPRRTSSSSSSSLSAQPFTC